MFKRQKQPETTKNQKRRLTAAEKREIRRIMEQARGDGKPHSAQDTLPFRQMYPDGLCKLDDTAWSRCIEFEDVNYQLAQPDDQTAIFEGFYRPILFSVRRGTAVPDGHEILRCFLSANYRPRNG